MTAPRGFVAHGLYSGIKERHEPDTGVLISDRACSAAGVFTTNVFKAACVMRNRAILPSSRIRAIVCNSGNANACTGMKGEHDNREIARSAASHVTCGPDEILTASTGVIGRPLAVSLITQSMKELVTKSDPQRHEAFCHAIRTTDTCNKTHAVTVETSYGTYTIGGCAKGSGMIHPNMATMLAFITTDAKVPPALLQRTVRRAADATFNCISVDGDMSTNDMVLACANGAAGITIESPSRQRTFYRALLAVCDALSRHIVSDGEGASKFVDIRVDHAASVTQARRAARAVASSTLLKCALFGNDPNWGRILSALGTTDVRIGHEALRIAIQDTCVYARTGPCEYDETELQALLSASEQIRITISLGAGNASGHAYTCDLTHDYVTINAEYHT